MVFDNSRINEHFIHGSPEEKDYLIDVRQLKRKLKSIMIFKKQKGGESNE